MPRERKQRGRRTYKKRKRDDEDVSDTYHRGPDDDAKIENDENTFVGVVSTPLREPVFYGLLSDEEQEYFKQADSLLAFNQFPNADDRTLFLKSVFKEANGKELKLASSQSCSRLLERLIILSEPAQLTTIFARLRGQYVFPLFFA